MDIQEIGLGDVEWINLAQCRQMTAVNEYSVSLKCSVFLEQQGKFQLLKKYPAAWSL